MTNKGATVKLTEKQRETLDRLARDLGYGYVGLSFVRPNTWRSLVAAGLVQECVTERGMFKLTEQGCAAAGVKATYMSNVRNAEAFAVIEHLRRGNDSAMRTAEAANLRDSQVLLDAHLKRIGVVGTELVNGRTRLWTVDLDEPDQSPKWIDTDPQSMAIFFARAEGCPVADEGDDIGEILHLIDNPPTAKELADRRNAEALEGVLESDEGYHVIGEVPRGKPAVEGVTSSYWVVPIAGDRLTDRHDMLGPYADRDMAEWKRDQYVEAGHPCSVLQSVTRPVLTAVPAEPTPSFAVGDQVQQLDGTPALVIEVVDGDTITVRTAESDLEECRGDELTLTAAAPGVAVPLTLAQYIVSVAATVPTAQRAALLAHS